MLISQTIYTSTPSLTHYTPSPHADHQLPQMVRRLTESWQQRSSAGRAKHPSPMTFTDHDQAMLVAIHRYDGLLTVDQLQRWCGYGTLRNAQRRVSILYNHKYLHRWKGVIWLDKRGAEHVAAQEAAGLPFKDFRWRTEPYASKVPHDLLLNEFRHAMEEAAAHHPMISLDSWWGQYECLAHFPKKTAYRDHSGERKYRRVQLDGLACLRFAQSPPRQIRFSIEFDNATESNVRFARDKVYPGIQFGHSAQYQETLHTQTTPVWLVPMTGSALRYQHVRKEVAAAGGAAYFLFTHAEYVNPETVLTGKIWQLPHRDELFSLEDYATDAFQTFVRESVQPLKQPTFLAKN